MCESCPYHYKTEEDRFACCHFEGPEGCAPCEIDDFEEEEEEDYPELIFDPEEEEKNED